MFFFFSKVRPGSTNSARAIFEFFVSFSRYGSLLDNQVCVCFFFFWKVGKNRQETGYQISGSVLGK